MSTLLTASLLTHTPSLEDINRLDATLEQYFSAQLTLEPKLTRPLVSFQANKTRPVYRWYKYKEAFSASLVEYLFSSYGVVNGRVLDPFAGSGTALFAASDLGLDSVGVELLPIGQQIIHTKQLLDSPLVVNDRDRLTAWARIAVWETVETQPSLPELRITKGAYSPDTHRAIEQYLAAADMESPTVRAVLRFALLCVLESISFTRKDGQYLRWDHRSGRRQGKKTFDKGYIPSFTHAIHEKLSEILADLENTGQLALFPVTIKPGQIELVTGSSLHELPKMPHQLFDAIITSPPYCNRYDYTRTYALELALLGTDEQGLSNLRQAMLSCTVENRAKDLLAINPHWSTAIAAADSQSLLQAILSYLDHQRASGSLNNTGIPRMVRGYFYEMACIIAECARLLKPGAPLFMVNDNVRYAGASISVDLILSAIAENLGLTVESILVLPTGKGNSSQQMGAHGRDSLRKCVYVWRKA